MAFQTGLSGLNIAATDLDIIGNNVANASTVGFKASRAQFSDVYAASLNGVGASQVGIGSKVSAAEQQFTQGNVSTTNNPLDIAINGNGFFAVSDNGVVSYTRSGQFHSNASGYIVTTEGLQLMGYGVDANGNVVASSPGPLQMSTAQLAPTATTEFIAGLNLDSRAAIPATQTAGTVTGTAGAIAFPLTITAGVNDTISLTLNGTAGTATIAANTYNTAVSLTAAVQTAINAVAAFSGLGYSATVSSNLNVPTITSDYVGNGSSVTVTGGTAQNALKLGTNTATAGSSNFSPSNPLSFTSSTSGTVYDTLGNAHVFTTYFIKTATPGQWEVQGVVDGTAITDVDLGAGAGNPIVLSFNSSGALTTTMPIDPVALNISGSAVTPLQLSLDFAGSTQFGTGFAVGSLQQNGFTAGRLAGFNVADDGMILGHYTNGQSKNLGQVVLSTFANTQGLKPLGNNRWEETSDSGLAVSGTPSSGSFGVLQSAAVEESNVDLTAELVRMITAQRVYQANAQTIKTQDAMMQTLVNLR